MATTLTGPALGLATAIAKLGIRHALVVTDGSHSRSGEARRIVTALPWEVSATLFEDSAPQPSERAARSAAELYALQGCDGIIGIGSRPSIALACLVGVLAAGAEPLRRGRRSADPLRGPDALPPVIAVPDDGADSEVENTVTVLLEDGSSLRLEGPQLAPAAVAEPRSHPI